MSPEHAPLALLAAEIRRDVPAAGGRLAAIRPDIDALGANEAIASHVALSLHFYYTAIETACERISRHFDGGVPGGEHGHRALLERMTLAPSYRPAVLSPATAAALRPLLGFRHFVRHAYAVEWNLSRLRELGFVAFQLESVVAAELRAFADFIDPTGP